MVVGRAAVVCASPLDLELETVKSRRSGFRREARFHRRAAAQKPVAVVTVATAVVAAVAPHKPLLLVGNRPAIGCCHCFSTTTTDK